MKEIEENLWKLQDKEYREFHRKLIPNVDPETIIGVRTPVLRTYAKQLLKKAANDPEVSGMLGEFLWELPHKYYEENNLHGMLLEGMHNFVDRAWPLDEFLPYVDNWATCDLIRPKALTMKPCEFRAKILGWMCSNHPYTVRFGIEMLMTYFLDDWFQEDYLNWVAQIRSEEYYVNMMIAWFFATALAKVFEPALPYIENQSLAVWTHNKTIQKAVESYRITPEQKTYLKTLKIKIPKSRKL